jgi:TRAP-type C4-dicarboxylate transport system permease small subunit
MYWISCVAIVAMVFLTVIDVVLRKIGIPIDFAFETVVLLAAVVIGFALPQTSLEHGHVAVEYLESKLSPRQMRPIYILSRLIGVGMFAIIGFYTIRLGNRLMQVQQVSPILRIPEFPVAYGLGACCFLECLVLFYTLGEEKP